MRERWMICSGRSMNALSFRTTSALMRIRVDPGDHGSSHVRRRRRASGRPAGRIWRRLPPHCNAIPRIAEIIDADEERRRLGRERFKAYRELKVTLETHQLDETAEI